MSHRIRCVALVLGLSLTATASAQTVNIVTDLNPGSASGASNGWVHAIGGRIVFAGNDGKSGFEVWATDGTKANTKLVKDINPGANSSIGWSARSGELVYFAADNGQSGRELWVTDGTAKGTWMVQQIGPGSKPGNPTYLIPTAPPTQGLWFEADGGQKGPELWFTLNGKSASRVTSTFGRAGSLNLGKGACTSKNHLVFATHGTPPATKGVEVWASKGGEPFLLKDIHPGRPSSQPGSFVRFDGKVYFIANDPNSGIHIWSSDATPAGTKVAVGTVNGVKLNVSTSAGLVVAGDRMFFSATDGKTGYELWVTDGTAAGTRMVKDIRSGSASSAPGAMRAVGDRVCFVANDGTNGGEPWISDGTAKGTYMLANVSTRPNQGGGGGGFTMAANGLIYFRTTTASFGAELWVSDGTPQNTRMAKDINPRTYSSYPTTITPLGCGVVFVAHNRTTGNELWQASANSKPKKRVARLSFKRIVNRNLQSPTLWTPATVQAWVNDLNTIFGKHLNLTFVVDEFVNLIDPGIPNSWWKFHSHDKVGMEKAAEANPSAYKWRTDAINIYLVHQLTDTSAVSSYASCPPDKNDIILIGVGGSRGSLELAHEIGHYFNLLHTHAIHEAPNCACSKGDCVTDTPNDINPKLYNTDAKRSAALRALGLPQALENVLRYNVMSYHGPITASNALLTCGQVWRMDDAIEKWRKHVIQGEPSSRLDTISPPKKVFPGPTQLVLAGRNLPTQGKITVRAGNQFAHSVTHSSTRITAKFPFPIFPGRHDVSVLGDGQLKVYAEHGLQVTPALHKPIDPNTKLLMPVTIVSTVPKATMILALGIRFKIPIRLPGVQHNLLINPQAWITVVTDASGRFTIPFKMSTLPLNTTIELQGVETKNGLMTGFTNGVKIVVP